MRAVDLSNNNRVTIRAIRDQMAAEGDPLGAVILKTTEGVTYVDPALSGFVSQCNELGVPWLAYHCVWNTGNGAAQARWLLAHSEGAVGLMLDWEKFGPPNAPVATTATVLDFMAELDRDPRPRFMYAAGWIFGYPGVVRDPRLARWPLITPDRTATAPWTGMVLQQNPDGYYDVGGVSIDVDVVRDPGFFESIGVGDPSMAELVLVQFTGWPALFRATAYTSSAGVFPLLSTVEWLSPEVAAAYSPHCRTLEVDGAATVNLTCLGPSPEGMSWFRVIKDGHDGKDGPVGMAGPPGLPGKAGPPGAPGATAAEVAVEVGRRLVNG